MTLELNKDMETLGTRGTDGGVGMEASDREGVKGRNMRCKVRGGNRGMER